MADDQLPDLTDRQEQVLYYLPASSEDLADHMGIGASTVRDHLHAIQNKEIDVQYDQSANQWFIADDRKQKLRRVSTQHKSQKTKEATAIIEQEESILLRRLNASEPLTATPNRSSGSESFCLILSDLHFGDLVEKEYWDPETSQYQTRTVYDVDIASNAVHKFGKKALQIKSLMENSIDFDDCHLFILGDVATGEGIYEGQVHDIEAHLSDQTTESVSALYNLTSTLAEEFESLQVRCVPGNHGTSRASASHGANTDLITYRWLDDRLRDSGYENISFATAEAHRHLNAQVRSWSFHCRHGHDGKEHVDETSYSQKLWRGWQEEFQYDVAMKGHHHKPAFHQVMNKYPVFSAPSPKPGGEFASQIGSPDVSRSKDLGWVFGVSDERPVTWQFLINEPLRTV